MDNSTDVGHKMALILVSVIQGTLCPVTEEDTQVQCKT